MLVIISFFFETNKTLDLRFRNLFTIFINCFFWFYRKIKLSDVNDFNKNKHYINQNILVSKINWTYLIRQMKSK